LTLYIDESGSINNHMPDNKYFIIALINVFGKESLRKAYKRFVSANYDRLYKLDCDRVHPQSGKVVKESGKMFARGKFQELKGSKFDKEMKQRFVEFFSRRQSFEIFYIKINNEKMSDVFCQNKARVFNYVLRSALEYLIKNEYLPNENCSLQLDERNEKTDSRMFLVNYLNTELVMNGTTEAFFNVDYYDSKTNSLIQIADVFANLYYSHLKTGGYEEEMKILNDTGILRHIFEFPAELPS